MRIKSRRRRKQGIPAMMPAGPNPNVYTPKTTRIVIIAAITSAIAMILSARLTSERSRVSHNILWRRVTDTNGAEKSMRGMYANSDATCF